MMAVDGIPINVPVERKDSKNWIDAPALGKIEKLSDADRDGNHLSGALLFAVGSQPVEKPAVTSTIRTT